MTNECKAIRQEIDHSDELTSQVLLHLRGCAECRSFQSQEEKLRALMAGLGTVSAPADFDFKLKARLAREKSSGSNGGAFASFLTPSRALAAVAVVLLLVAGVLLSKTWFVSSPPPGVA